MKKTNLRLSKDELKYIRNLMLISLMVNFIVEILNTDSLLATLSSILHRPHIFIYNTCIILVTLSITLLLKHRLVACAFLSAIWIIFGITNNVLLNFRTTPFTAVDFTLISEAIPIVDKYLTTVQIIGIILLFIVVIVGLIIAFIKLPKHKAKINYLTNSIAIVTILLVTLGLTSIGMKTNVLAKNFGNIADAFKDYGFSYCFTNSLINTGIDKPSNYSEETIQSIVDATETDAEAIPDTGNESNTSTTQDEAKTPNIIFLQLESFFDVTHLEGITYSEDPLPNFHRLKKEYSSGYLSVPSVGAGTANTEFEIITGMNLDFFGPGEYPYKTILKETTSESMAYNLKELGYSTHAIHNNTATFYERNKVFANLGFDSFVSSEYMENISYNLLGWANDDVLVEEIMNVLNSTDTTDYIYTISVQGHGKYPQDAQSLLEGAVSEGMDGDFREDVDEVDVDKADVDDVDVDEVDEDVMNAMNTVDSTQNSKDTLAGASEPSDTTTDSSSSSYDIIHEITVSGMEEERAFAFEYYVNQIHEMDIFLGNLIETLKHYDEDVILVAYGDHLPSLGIEEEDLTNKDMFQTEYFIWCSDGVIEGKHDRDLQAYQLSAYTLFLINQSPGLLTKVHQKEFAGDYASVDVNNVHTSNSPTSNNTLEELEQLGITYLDELELLQYDMLYGKQECYNNNNPYAPTILRMGYAPVTIEDVEYDEASSTVTISGQHFTNASRIQINGELVETTLVNHNKLTCKSHQLSPTTEVAVVQVTNDEIVLSSSDLYVIE